MDDKSDVPRATLCSTGEWEMGSNEPDLFAEEGDNIEWDELDDHMARICGDDESESLCTPISQNSFTMNLRIRTKPKISLTPQNSNSQPRKEPRLRCRIPLPYHGELPLLL